MGNKTIFGKSENFWNREISWLEFNYRVLSEARDVTIPLFERMKFLSITASNLDEFFMIRIASLKDMVHAGYRKKDIAGMTASEQLKALIPRTHKFTKVQYETYKEQLLPALAAEGLHLIAGHEQLTKGQELYLDELFQKEIYPVLTPMAVDSSRPFPLIRNKTLNIGALIVNHEKGKEAEFATVQVPDVLPRVISVPSEDGKKNAILLEEIIERNLQQLFVNCEILCAHPYRIIRNADLSIDEEEAADLLKEIEKKLKKRQWGEVIKLEVEANIDENLLKILKKEFDVSEESIYEIDGPLDLKFLMKVYGMEGFEHLKFPVHRPQPLTTLNQDEDLFTQIKRKDILIHLPYDSFDPVVEFVKQAAKDKDVLAIKQTLYRVSGNSPIVAALAKAAENGKQVTVLVELKARFDEENNINWAKALEKAGCHVIYGLIGLKTHSKITLVVRREEDGIKRYVHLGTGNYNDITAKLYTDMGILTADDSIGEDATAVFNMLSGYSEPSKWNHLLVAPIWLRDSFLRLIQREIANAKAGRKAHIIAKMNSLCDAKIIEALYEASFAGVKIELIVRGICCLKTELPEISENITVRSIVGTFLEHSRIFYFYNGGEEEVYMGSADWMPRNLDKRVEIVFPVLDEDLKKQVIEIVQIQLKDNKKAHILKQDGSYEKVKPLEGEKPLNSQEYFVKQAKKRQKGQKEEQVRIFKPALPVGEFDLNKIE